MSWKPLCIEILAYVRLTLPLLFSSLFLLARSDSLSSLTRHNSSRSELLDRTSRIEELPSFGGSRIRTLPTGRKEMTLRKPRIMLGRRDRLLRLRTVRPSQ